MGLGGLIASAAGPLIGGILGGNAASGDRNAAAGAMAAAVAAIDAIGAPPDLSKRILLEKFQQAGLLTPQMEDAINTGVSKASQISENKKVTDAQMGALESMRQQSQGGLSPADRAAYAELQDQVAQATHGRDQAIIQNMQQRGISGSGAELAARLAGSQAGTQDLSKQGMEIGAQASQKALQALSAYGGMAGQIRGQDFSNNLAKAQAADEFNRFNTGNLINQQQRNVGAQNTSQQYNLTNKQNISNANVQQDNDESRRQLEAKRQQWLDSLAQAQAKANALTGQASSLEKSGDRKAKSGVDIGTGVGGILGMVL